MSFLKRLFPWRLCRVADAPEAMPVPAHPEFVDSRTCGLIDAVQAGWYLNDSGELLRGFAIRPGDTVLDFGCGEGGASLFAARQGSEVIFADTDAPKIAALEGRMPGAGARAWRGIVCGDICKGERLPLADGSVTRVIAMEVLEHVSDPGKVLDELVRVAAPGALFLVSVPDPAGEALQQIVAPPGHFQPPNHIHIFSREAFAELLADAGLLVEQAHYSGFYWSLWMCFYWTIARADSMQNPGATRDAIGPPYHPLLDQWARTWQTLIDLPEGASLRSALDEFMPKSQTLIARKPGTS